jgi:hypothetical protein
LTFSCLLHAAEATFHSLNIVLKARRTILESVGAVVATAVVEAAVGIIAASCAESETGHRPRICSRFRATEVVKCFWRPNVEFLAWVSDWVLVLD